MSETRTIETIQQEFYGLCARAGQLQYQVHTSAKDLEQINKQIRDLNLEAAALKAKQDADAKAQADVVSQAQAASVAASDTTTPATDPSTGASS